MVTLFNLFQFLLLFLFLGFIVYFYKEINEIKKKKEEDLNLEDKLLNFFQNLETGIFQKFNLLKDELNKRFFETIEREQKFLETSTRLEELAKSLSLSLEETKEIKNILSGPKERGFFGEIMVEEILKNLPNSYYEKQYRLGFDQVDYVLKFNDKLIPIDAKFPYQKLKEINDKNQLKKEIINNLKSKIESVSRKYIQPYKNTVDFAIIYLANEGLYYEILSDKTYDEIWEFAREKSVVLTSPKTFEILISSLLLAFKKQEMAQNLTYLLEEISQIEKDLRYLEESFEKAFNQLNNGLKNLHEFSRNLIKLSASLKNILQFKNKNLKIKERSLI